ncbi:ras association domain-containing protein 4a isoform X3 [Osmerus eperlanus]|uniref:ras association domain-containing protein 4a isoform X3 n=1 Tax=Osmerus eperlanus TaxID=29151 RepID=UPI002E1113E3
MAAGQMFVKLNQEKIIPKSDVLSLLRTYNCYHEGKSFQLRAREEDGELILEGLLNIYWGLRRPIRLQMHDDNERFCYGSPGVNRNERSLLSMQPTSESNNNILGRSNGPALTMGGSVAVEEKREEEKEEEVPQLLRTRSDASFVGVLRRRCKSHSAKDMQRLRTHRYSINGHFYNHKVENQADEFVLYMVHETGERSQLRESGYPLVSRVLYGPCEKISKIFIMESDLGEEVTYDVAQYIKFEMPVLDSFVVKLKEEEEREISRLTRKYSALKSMILQQLEGVPGTADLV